MTGLQGNINIKKIKKSSGSHSGAKNARVI